MTQWFKIRLPEFVLYPGSFVLHPCFARYVNSVHSYQSTHGCADQHQVAAADVPSLPMEEVKNNIRY